MKKDPRDLIRDLHHQIAILTTLYEVSKRLGESLDFRVTLNGVLEVLSDRLAMRRSIVTLITPETKEPVMELIHGITFEEKKRGKYKLDTGILSHIL